MNIRLHTCKIPFVISPLKTSKRFLTQLRQIFYLSCTSQVMGIKEITEKTNGTILKSWKGLEILAMTSNATRKQTVLPHREEVDKERSKDKSKDHKEINNSIPTDLLGLNQCNYDILVQLNQYKCDIFKIGIF